MSMLTLMDPLGPTPYQYVPQNLDLNLSLKSLDTSSLYLATEEKL